MSRSAGAGPDDLNADPAFWMALHNSTEPDTPGMQDLPDDEDSDLSDFVYGGDDNIALPTHIRKR